MSSALSKKYLEHPIFKQLCGYSDFYSSLSDLVMYWSTQGTGSAINIDTYVFTSIKGTLESIHDTLQNGRINDSYALLRKYYDATIINLYSNIYLSDNFSIDNFIVKKINNWVKGKEKIPSFKVMSTYIIESPDVQEITDLIYNKGSFLGSSFENLRKRCNDHTHYLYYYNLLLNDNQVCSPNRLAILNDLSKELNDIFIMHLSYLFYHNGHYMMSSEYKDCLDNGITPEEGSQYDIAPFIQDIFDTIIKVNRPDIVEKIKEKTSMRIE